MRLKNLLAVILTLIVLGIAALFIFRGSRRQITSEEADAPNQQEADIPNQPISGIRNATRPWEETSPQAKKVYEDIWEEWIYTETKYVFNEFLKFNPDRYSTDEEKARLWKRLHAQSVVQAAEMKEKYGDAVPIFDKGKMTIERAPLQTHDGPQTPEALMETFDVQYSKHHRNTNNVDETYPRAEWLQMILSKGYHIKTHLDYAAALRTRYWIAEVADKPEVWGSGRRGVPPTDDFETYKDAYIQRQFWQKEQVDLAEQADPEVSGGFFFDDRPDVFLPAKKNRLYVNRDFDSMKTWGPILTTKQHFDLLHRGVEPEGWEVIYLDEDYNVLSEEPPHITRETVKGWELPPEDWVPPADVELPEDFEEELRARGWKGTWTQQPPPGTPSPQDRVAEAAEQQRAAETEWKHFEQMLREFEEFSKMSDADKGVELWKRATPQLPEPPTGADVENELRDQLDAEARVKRAETLLEQYGFKEGLRRLAKEDPEIADQIRYKLRKVIPLQETGEGADREAPPPAETPSSPEEGP